MRTEIKVMEYVPEGPPFQAFNSSALLSVDEVPRSTKESWIRLTRYTYNDNGGIIKREIGIFGARGGDFEIRWREFQLGQAITDVALMDQYLVWVK